MSPSGLDQFQGIGEYDHRPPVVDRDYYFEEAIDRLFSVIDKLQSSILQSLKEDLTHWNLKSVF